MKVTENPTYSWIDPIDCNLYVPYIRLKVYTENRSTVTGRLVAVRALQGVNLYSEIVGSVVPKTYCAVDVFKIGLQPGHVGYHQPSG